MEKPENDHLDVPTHNEGSPLSGDVDVIMPSSERSEQIITASPPALALGQIMTRRRLLAAAGTVGLGWLIFGCADKKSSQELGQPNDQNRGGNPQYPPDNLREVASRRLQQPPQRKEIKEINESEIYKVSIPRLRETLLRTGILVLTHNGSSDRENEFRRVVDTPELGLVSQRFGPRIAKKQCRPKIITGLDAGGNDKIQDVTPIDCFVVDATGGVLPSNISHVLGNKKFGLILCAGHVHDIESLARLSDQFRDEESMLLLGGCRTASMIGKFHKPQRLVAGTNASLHTETFTHLTKVTAATLIGRQFSTWPEYFRNLQINYSYELQREPGTYIFPGNPLYPGYAQRER